MIIGVDFDNTVVCYDRLFHRVAVEWDAISPALPADKESVRNYLRSQDREDVWTELQGWVYGVRIPEAEPFPGALAFFAACRRRGITVYIISHKTRQPVRGPQADLHAAARGWLESHGFHAGPASLPRDQVFFEETKSAKLQRIAERGCSHYLDDLPEFLLEPTFPPHVDRMLFDPWNRHAGRGPFRRVSDWHAARQQLLGDEVS